MATLLARIKLRGDTLDNWTTNDPLLKERELAIVTGGMTGPDGAMWHQAKIGPGYWSVLPFIHIGNAELMQAALDAKANTADLTKAVQFKFSSNTSDANPGSGTFRLNNAVIASATNLYINLSDLQGNLLTALLDDLAGDRLMAKQVGGTGVLVFNTSSVTTATGYRKIALTYTLGELPEDGTIWEFSFSGSGASGGSASWGSISGSLSAQTDLQAALAGKATEAYVDSAVSDAIDALLAGAPGALDTLSEIADALSNDADFAGSMTTLLALKAPLANPAFTGNPTVPTQTPGDNTTRAASTAFVAASFAPLANPIFTGNPTAPTPTAGDDSTKIATTAFVNALIEALLQDPIDALMPGTVANGTYTLVQYATTAGTIDELIGKMGSGTLNAAITINGTTVTGISALAASSTVASSAASALNVYDVGDTIALVISGGSSPVDFAFTLARTRTL